MQPISSAWKIFIITLSYFKQQRHTRFHANQVLVLTTMIFRKEEADAIISDVLTIIDGTAQKIM